jgi:hypothetical protein
VQLEPPLKPVDLKDDEQRDREKVDQYETLADTQVLVWDQLDLLLDTVRTARTLNEGEQSALEYWLTQVVVKGPQSSTFTNDYGAAELAASALEHPNDRTRDLLDAANDADIRRAVGGPAPSAARRKAATELTGPPKAARVEAAPQRRGPLPAVALAAVVASLLAWVVLRTCTRETILAVALYAAILGGAAIALTLARREKKVPVLIAAAIGTALAAAFGGADALDASKGWGSAGDIVKTIGASFTVVGALQLARFGLPLVGGAAKE